MLNLKVLLLIAVVIFMSSCSQKQESDVSLITADNLVIMGTFHKASSDKGLILLHQLNSNRHSYDEFTKVALKNDYSVLAIDFRGHGDSERKWQEFNEDDFRAMENDVFAAKKYLKEQNIKKIYIIGASIGANTAINYAAKNKDIEGVVALSPSFNYKGISTRETILNFNRPLMIMVSKGDSQSLNDSMIMSQLTTVDLVVLTSSTHGTDMQDNITESKIIEWLNK
jgi:alpha-beta hydrolase superfamily lysophospholipase